MSRRGRQNVRRGTVKPAGNLAGPIGGGWIGKAACVAVVMLAFVFSFHKLDDFDTWWHLAAGRWIAIHHAIPVTDTLSHTVRDHPWINLQWGFDLGLYLLHALGGPVLLCVAGAIVFSSAVILLLRFVVLHLGSSLGALFGLLVLLTAQERVVLRPELLSFLLLAGVLSVLEQARLREGRSLFLLVPLMVVWVNVHALFIVGAFAIVCAVAGNLTAPSRRLALWGGVALASVLINPYGLQGALFPLKLISRIDGSSPVYQIIGEFGAPFAAGATGLVIVLYKILLTIGCGAALTALIVSLRSTRARSPAPASRFDWGGLIFFVALAGLSIAARRNVALFAIGSAPFIARCVRTILAASPRPRAIAARRAPLIAAAVALSTALICTATVTGAFYKWDRQPEEFGAGVIEGTFPVRAVAFARAAGLPSKLYNDMSAGGYLTWDEPVGDGVFVDGRLEVYDTPFLTEYAAALSDPVRWQNNADRYGVQTAIIFHRFENERLLVGRLSRSNVWSLVYADEVAAIFVRTQGNDAALARAASLRDQWSKRTDDWLSRPVGPWRYSAGRVEGTRSLARFYATVGSAEPAVSAYLKLLELGIPTAEELDVRLRLARRFASTSRLDQAREQARRILVIDRGNLEAQRLLQ
jgi:hypothetical protein